jgi:[lysine-biosynthesis-protein LysW]--L-2-aminoadipate ligase
MEMGIVLSRVRKDEKRLIAEAGYRGIDVTTIDNTRQVFELDRRHIDLDVVLERCVDHHRAVYALTVFDHWGIPTVNRQSVVETCGNRLLTTLAFRENGVPTPEVRVAYTPNSALEAMEDLGYPVVLRPVEGPEDQLVSRIGDKYTAATVLEHKRILGAYHHSIFFMQKHVDAPGHDIRAYVVGDETVAAVSVLTHHWIGTIADGGLMKKEPVTDELNALAVSAVKSVGGGIAVVDMVRTRDAWFVQEMGRPTGLSDASDATGVNIPGKIMDYVVDTVEQGGRNS